MGMESSRAGLSMGAGATTLVLMWYLCINTIVLISSEPHAISSQPPAIPSQPNTGVARQGARINK